jgi:hypothetical protein
MVHNHLENKKGISQDLQIRVLGLHIFSLFIYFYFALFHLDFKEQGLGF